MKLEVPVIRQAPSSCDCCYACFAMILAFYGEDVSIEDLKATMEDWFLTTLSGDLLERGYSVRMKTLHPYLFTLADAGRLHSPRELLARFDWVEENAKLDDDGKLALAYAQSFVRLGGEIEVGVPTAQDIRAEVDAGHPLVAAFEHRFLAGDRPGSYLHANVITGIDDELIYVNDPLWDDRGGQKSYPIEAFLYAIHLATLTDLDNGSLFMFRPPGDAARFGG